MIISNIYINLNHSFFSIVHYREVEEHTFFRAFMLRWRFMDDLISAGRIANIKSISTSASMICSTRLFSFRLFMMFAFRSSGSPYLINQSSISFRLSIFTLSLNFSYVSVSQKKRKKI